jgi:hypothetical protein
MKKMLLSAVAALTLGSAAMAQKIDNRNESRFPAANQPANPFKANQLKKGGEFISDWYSLPDITEQTNVGANLSEFVNFLVHDTLAKFVEDDGVIRYGSWVSVGQVIDPKDDLIQLTDKPNNQLSRFNSYKCDSIAFPYLYVRNVDSVSDGMGGKVNVVDTLFIAYFAGSQIRKLEFTQSKDKLAMVDWNFARRMPANYVKMDTILLNSGVTTFIDTTRANNNNGGWENSWSLKTASFPAPAGIQVNLNPNGGTTANLVGFTFTFKAGVPAVVNGDTAVYIYQLDPATKPSNMRRSNYFGCYFSSNASGIPFENKTFFNTSLVGLKDVSYRDINGWQGYVSGNAFTNDIFIQSFFHLTVTGNIGAGMEDAEPISISKVFPNPARNTVEIDFDVTKSSDVKVSIVNLVGQEVLSNNFGKVNAGKYNLPMNISNLNPGIYVVTVEAGNASTSQKLVITE